MRVEAYEAPLNGFSYEDEQVRFFDLKKLKKKYKKRHKKKKKNQTFWCSVGNKIIDVAISLVGKAAMVLFKRKFAIA